ncbi:MAG: hypothetical protein P1V20_08620, partial [Verrucomicrobiales bacterium]|nr:hypothetical protein [Verrucomicrobiales bacterium]
MDWLPPDPDILDFQFPDYDVLEIIVCGQNEAIYKAVQKQKYQTVVIKLFASEAEPIDLEPASLFCGLAGSEYGSILESGKTTGGHFFVVGGFGDRVNFSDWSNQSFEEISDTEDKSPPKRHEKIFFNLILAAGLVATGVFAADHFRTNARASHHSSVHRITYQHGVDHGFGRYNSNRHVRIM